MNQDIVKIADLSNFSISESENVTIKASVSIKSIRHGNNRHAYFYMDLRDDSGEITAVAYSDNEPCDNQLHIIEENKTYIFANVLLANSKRRYTSIPLEREIVLNEESIVQLCGNAPKLQWTLTPLNEVYDQDKPKMFNIVGLCTRVTETTVVLGELTRQVTLVDESRTEVILNVWNQETSLFDELDLNYHPVIFVKDARIHKYQGRTSLTTSRYLRLVNPNKTWAVKIRKAILQTNSPINPNLNTSRALARIGAIQRDTAYPYCTPSNFTKKNRNYIKITDLSDDSISKQDNVTVIATVTMKSMRHGKKDRAFFHMDLRDESGEIAAVAFDEACVKYQQFIEKNMTYWITGFYLANADKRGTSIPHQKLLVLKHDSDVKLCGYAPKVEWPLSPLTVVHAQDKTEYYHAFGLCTNVTETESVSSLGKITRQVTLLDQLRRELILKVWDKETAVFDALDLNTHPVFFVKDARILDTNEGNTTLTTCKYLELLDPSDPRACRVTKGLESTSGPQHSPQHDIQF